MGGGCSSFSLSLVLGIKLSLNRKQNTQKDKSFVGLINLVIIVSENREDFLLSVLFLVLCVFV